ncbi:hypothetical protein MAXJ12_24872 [Mesorhizobium alhagi CCNWXJ12-2]|uniref:Uncharacterized protein n=1 Tax=Mesorhizobium alhagi CCNWXJ12-2 TaxID=1107882 RepID=H0HXS5_9HYPH|nr:hypothetical protein MAXJ12_24872 [Mesorhizobium alhagi CCNWXJ12-2]
MFGNRRHFAIFSRIPRSAWNKSVKRVNANHRLSLVLPRATAGMDHIRS